MRSYGELQARYLELLGELERAARGGGSLYEVIDLADEMDGVLDMWCESSDALRAERSAS